MKSALLIIDIQAALCSGEWSAFDIDAAVDRINAVARKARAADAPVFLIQHEEADGPLQHGSDGWRLYERLEVRPGDIRIRKTATDSFYRTELHSHLRSRDVAQVIVSGCKANSAWIPRFAARWLSATRCLWSRMVTPPWTTASSPRPRSRPITT